MEIIIHSTHHTQIVEVISGKIILENAQDGLDLLGNFYYQGFDKVILHQKNIAADFFDLKTGIAGEILQKFSNYRVRLIIVGNVEHYSSQSLRDFMRESNKGSQVNFISSVSEAIAKFSD